MPDRVLDRISSLARQENKRLAAQTFAFHPLAGEFPPIASMEFAALVADIKAKGLREPITLYEGKILDGIHRYRACLQTGVDPQFKTFEGTEQDARAFVNSKNFHRRHLSPKERRDRLAEFVKANLKKSDRQLAKEAGTTHPTIAKARKHAEATGKALPVETRTGADGKARKPPVKKNKAIKPVSVSADVEKSRNEAAARIRGLRGVNEPEARGADPGIDGGGNSRQDGSLDGDHRGDDHRDGDRGQHHGQDGGAAADIDELQDRLRRQEIQIAGLESEIEELKTATPTVVEHLTASQLVDALDNRLRRDGINASAQLRKIRDRIDQHKPQIDLEVMPAMGAEEKYTELPGGPAPNRSEKRSPAWSAGPVG
jgi:ParB-like chromosome segregation protein Spo0J